MKALWVSGLLLASVCGIDCQAQTVQTDGDLKYRLVNTAYPESSLFRESLSANATDHSLSARLNINAETKRWSAELSYQLAGFHGDTLEATPEFSGSALLRSPVQTDNARLLDLTSLITDKNDYAVSYRLDRLKVSYQGANNIVKIGRQAVSWGNGLIYTPMDFFNPFDPSAIDTEYKTGEDMLYAQHLFNNGDDLQMVWVARRDDAQKTSRDVNSLALKYHGFVGSSEFDVLIAEHYQDMVIGLGASTSVGGSVVRADWVMTDTDDERFSNFVANISYSWVAWDKNVTGSLEYFHNDFGLRGDNLGVADLAASEALSRRLRRGELFTLGRDYVAASAVVEMAPLWLVTPSVFYNISDNSALAQLVSQHDLSQNTQLVVALSLPMGSKGTEYGGLPFASDQIDLEEKFSNSSWSLFAQAAWYF